MNSENEFKKILNEKLNEKEFQFDLSAWEDARDLIDAHREEKKKRPFLFLLSAALLFISGGIAIWLFMPQNSATQLSQTKTEEVKGTNSNSTKLPPTASSSETSVINTSENKTEKTNSEKTDHKITSKTDNTIEKIISDERKIDSETKKSTVNINEKTDEKRLSESITLTRKNKTSARNNSIAVSTQPLKTVASKKNTTVRGETSKNETESGNNETDPVINTQTANISTITVNTSTSAPSLDEGIANADPVNTQTINGTQADSNIATTTSVVTIDSASSVVQTPIKPEKNYNGIISAEAGTYYFIGWKNPGKRDARGYNPVIGINYTTKIYKKISISAGMQYYWIGQLSYSNHTSKITRYSLGEESQVTVITPKRLHYAGFPLLINYAFNPVHQLSLGCNVAYLFGVNTTEETYRQNIHGISDRKITKTSGYTEGFSPFDTQILLLYRFNLRKDLYLNSGIVYGLTDTKDNAFFRLNEAERNIGIKLTLTYNLFKK